MNWRDRAMRDNPEDMLLRVHGTDVLRLLACRVRDGLTSWSPIVLDAIVASFCAQYHAAEVSDLPCGHAPSVGLCVEVRHDLGRRTSDAMIRCPMCGERCAGLTLWPPLR